MADFQPMKIGRKKEKVRKAPVKLGKSANSNSNL